MVLFMYIYTILWNTQQSMHQYWLSQIKLTNSSRQLQIKKINKTL